MEAEAHTECRTVVSYLAVQFDSKQEDILGNE